MTVSPSQSDSHAQDAPRVQRQISLPLSKAVELAYQSLRLRLSRSLLVTSGIVLALAFLMSILTTDAILRSMQTWSQHVTAQGRAAPQLLDAQRLQATMNSA